MDGGRRKKFFQTRHLRLVSSEFWNLRDKRTKCLQKESWQKGMVSEIHEISIGNEIIVMKIGVLFLEGNEKFSAKTKFLFTNAKTVFRSSNSYQDRITN